MGAGGGGGRGSVKLPAKSSFPSQSNLPSTVISLPALSNLNSCVAQIREKRGREGRKVTQGY